MNKYQNFVTVLQQGRRPTVGYRRKCEILLKWTKRLLRNRKLCIVLNIHFPLFSFYGGLCLLLSLNCFTTLKTYKLMCRKMIVMQIIIVFKHANKLCQVKFLLASCPPTSPNKPTLHLLTICILTLLMGLVWSLEFPLN